jgi:transposase
MVEDGDVQGGTGGRRRYWTIEEKRQIVEQTLSSSMSVATVARQHGVNANQVFYWRKLYRVGQLGSADKREPSTAIRLLPVSVEESESPTVENEEREKTAPVVTMNIEIPGRALVSLEGALDVEIVRAVLMSLQG